MAFGVTLVVRRLVQMGLVGAIIFVSVTSAVGVSTSTSAGMGMSMSGLSVLHLWGFDWDAVVDDWDVLGSVPGTATSMVSWAMGDWSWGVVWGGWGMVGVCVDLSVSGSVEGLGVLDFGGFYRNTIVDLWDMDGSVPLLNWGAMRIPMVTSWSSLGGHMGVGSEVSSLGSGHFRGIGRNVRSRTDRSQQQN